MNFLFIFKSIFKRKKQTCFYKKIQPNLKWKKILIYLFSIYRMKEKKEIKVLGPVGGRTQL
jgi:hypothetical protein